MTNAICFCGIPLQQHLDEARASGDEKRIAYWTGMVANAASTEPIESVEAENARLRKDHAWFDKMGYVALNVLKEQAEADVHRLREALRQIATGDFDYTLDEKTVAAEALGKTVTELEFELYSAKSEER